MRAVVPRWARRAVGALVCAALVAGCQTGATPAAPAAAPNTSAQVVMIIRHGEKPDGDEHGVDADGKKDDASLTPTGWDRARGLVGLFDPVDGRPRAGLARPVAIYAAGVTDDGNGERTRQTVAPLAAKLGVQVDTTYGRGEEDALVEHVAAQPGPVLICWQHGGLPDLAGAFPGVTPQPPSQWPDDRFDVVWTLTRTDAGWRFGQVPEQVLPGDGADVVDD